MRTDMNLQRIKYFIIKGKGCIDVISDYKGTLNTPNDACYT